MNSPQKHPPSPNPPGDSPSDPVDLPGEQERWTNLVSRIRSTDAEAAGEWVASQTRAVGLLLRRRLGSAATPELAQAALADAVLEIRAGRIENPRQFLDWLQRFALRYAVDHAEPAVTADPAPSAPQVSQLTRALRRCDPRTREAMRRFYLEGEPAELISGDLGYENGEFLQVRIMLRSEVSALRQRKPAESAGEARTRSAGTA